MTPDHEIVYSRIAGHLKDRLAQAGRTWVTAWFLAEAGSDSLTVSIGYQDRIGGEPRGDVEADFDVFDWFGEMRALTPESEGQRWTWARLSVTPDGRHDVAVRYPVHPPVQGREYTGPEIVATIAACVRNNLADVSWAEAWVEVGPDFVPFVYYRDANGGRPSEGRL